MSDKCTPKESLYANFKFFFCLHPFANFQHRFVPSFWEVLKRTAELVQQGALDNTRTCKLWYCVCNNFISFQARFCCPPNIVLRLFPPTFASLLWKLFVCCNSQVLPTPSSWHLLLAFPNISKYQSVTNCHCQSKSINSGSHNLYNIWIQFFSGHRQSSITKLLLSMFTPDFVWSAFYPVD